MVTPERDVPGISASTWAQPIKSASLKPIWVMLCSRAPILSAMYRAEPKKMLVQPTHPGIAQIFGAEE